MFEYGYDKAGSYFKIFLGVEAMKTERTARISRLTIDAAFFMPRTCEVEFSGEYADLSPDSDFSVFAYSGGAFLGDVLFKGKVMTSETRIDEGNGMRVTVRAFDHSRHMIAGARTRMFEDMTYSEVIKAVAKPYGLAPFFFGLIERSQPKLPSIVQMNETDWDFVCRLAREMGWVAYVDHYVNLARMPQVRLCFAKPGDLRKASSGGGSSRKAFKVGDGRVISISATLSGAGLPNSVQVPGWDGLKEAPALGKSSLGSKNFVVAKEDASRPFKSNKAGTFTSTGRMASSNTEANMLAKGLATRYAASATDVDMLVRGHPAVKLNEAIGIGGIERYREGRFIVSGVVHEFTSEFGFQTNVYCTGLEDRSLSGLQGAGVRRPVLTGVYPAVVNDLDDPKKAGRVTLNLPWLDSAYVTGWARIVQMGAGKGVGWQYLPAPKDEVLVAFENGQLETPYVIGGIGGKDGKVPPAKLMSEGKPVKQVFTTKSGHQLVFDDEGDDAGITIQAKNGSTCSIVLSDKQGITIMTKGETPVAIKAGGDVTVTAKKNATINAQNANVNTKAAVTVKAKGKVDVSGSSISIDATGSATIKGAKVSIEATGPLSLKGKMVSIQ